MANIDVLYKIVSCAIGNNTQWHIVFHPVDGFIDGAVPTNHYQISVALIHTFAGMIVSVVMRGGHENTVLQIIGFQKLDEFLKDHLQFLSTDFWVSYNEEFSGQEWID